MTLKRIRKVAVVLTLTLVSTTTLSAQFGGLGGLLGGFAGMGAGIPVFDAGNLMESVKQTAQLIQQFLQLKAQYDHMIYQAKRIKDLDRYQAPKTIWQGMTAENQSGRTHPWVQAVNRGVGAGGGWSSNVTSIFGYRSMGNIPSSQQARKNIELAGIELADGTAVSAIDSIGQVRASGPKTEIVLEYLQQDSLAKDPDMHTEAAQMNKANAIAVLQTRELANQNKLLLATAEINLIQLRQQREAAAYALASDAAYRADGRTAIASTLSNASDAMRSFRLP